MEDKIELGGNNFDVEEGPLEETIDSPRFYNLSVEETVADVQLQDASAGPHGRGRIVFSPDGKHLNRRNNLIQEIVVNMVFSIR